MKLLAWISALMIGSAAMAPAATPLALDGNAVNGNLDTSDTAAIPMSLAHSAPGYHREVFTFTGQAQETVDLRLTSGGFDGYLILLGPQQNLIAENDDAGGDMSQSRIAVSLPEAGEYTLIVTSFGPNSSGSFTLTGASLGVGAPIPADAMMAQQAAQMIDQVAPTLSGLTRMGVSQSPPIQGTATQGQLTSGENTAPLPPSLSQSGPQYYRDVHPVTGAPGQMISIDLQADFDCLLILIGPDGSVVAENDDYEGTNHSRLTEVPFSQAGTYSAVVTSYAPGVTGNYTLTIGHPTAAQPPSADAPLAIGQSVSGTLASGDRAALPLSNERHGSEYWRDGYAITSAGNQGIVLDLTSDFDAYLLFLDPAGNVIAANDDFGDITRSHVQAALPQPGTHRAIVTSLNPGEGGTYSLTAGQPPPPSVDTPITMGQTLQGSLAQGDNAVLPPAEQRANGQFMNDGYVFDATAGMTVQIDVTGDLDTFIYLIGPSGQEIDSNDDFGNTNASRITAMLQETGPHRVVVSSYGEGEMGNYSITVQQVPSGTAFTQTPPVGTLQLPTTPAQASPPMMTPIPVGPPVPGVAPFTKQ